MPRYVLSRNWLFVLRRVAAVSAAASAAATVAIWRQWVNLPIGRLDAILVLVATPIFVLGLIQARAWSPWRETFKSNTSSKKQLRRFVRQMRDVSRYARSRRTLYEIAVAFLGAGILTIGVWSWQHNPEGVPEIVNGRYCLFNHGPCQPISRAEYDQASAEINTGMTSACAWLLLCSFVALDAVIFFSEEKRRLTSPR